MSASTINPFIRRLKRLEVAQWIANKKEQSLPALEFLDFDAFIKTSGKIGRQKSELESRWGSSLQKFTNGKISHEFYEKRKQRICGEKQALEKRTNNAIHNIGLIPDLNLTFFNFTENDFQKAQINERIELIHGNVTNLVRQYKNFAGRCKITTLKILQASRSK